MKKAASILFFLLLAAQSSFAIFDATDYTVCTINIECDCGTFYTYGFMSECAEGWGFCFSDSTCNVHGWWVDCGTCTSSGSNSSNPRFIPRRDGGF